MKTFRNHWQSFGVVALAAMVVSVFWMQRSTTGAMVAMQAPAAPIDRLERDAIVELLEDVSLDRDALIALNLSAQQASDVLSSVRTWYETNASTLASLQGTVDQHILTIRQLEKATRMGPADVERDQQLAVARQDLATAKAARESALDSLKTNVNSDLSAGQQTTWLAIATGHGQTMPLRMLDLTSSQRVALSKAKHHHRWRRNSARDEQARATAATTLATELNTILTQDQQNLCSSYDSYYAASSGVVATAWNEVLALEQG